MTESLTPDQLAIAQGCGLTPERFAAALADDERQATLAARMPQPTAAEIFANCGLSPQDVGSSDVVSLSFEIAALSAQTEGGTALIQVTPAQDFAPSDGRKMIVPAWRMNAQIAAKVIAAFNAAQPMVIDYDHQSLNTKENGQHAPAAGWIRGLKWLEGKGIYAVAELTKRALQMVRDGEYRYFSPVLQYDKHTGEVLRILMGALTNNPAIHGMDGVTVI